MVRIASVSVAAAITCFVVSTPSYALDNYALRWLLPAAGGPPAGQAVPELSTSATVTMSTLYGEDINGRYDLPNGWPYLSATIDGDQYTWVQPIVRQQGGSVVATVEFDDPVPVDRLVALFRDLADSTSISVTPSGGTATFEDFTGFPGPATGTDPPAPTPTYSQLNGVVSLQSDGDNHRAIFIIGNSADTATALTLEFMNPGGGDFINPMVGVRTLVSSVPGVSWSGQGILAIGLLASGMAALVASARRRGLRASS